jgi:hypothetical protein
MKTTSIHIEGQIISPEIFDRLESNDLTGQLPQNYGLDKGKRIKDEIALAWADAKDQWNIFKRRIEKLGENESGTAETRKYWIIPLFETLGYNIVISRAEEVNGNSFAISHRAQNLDGFPVHIVGVNDSLDRKRETGGPRLSPHALVQEYLNITEHLYAVVTNGYQLRILRDSGKLIRLTYMEFDLLQMMEDDLYAEFSIMYRLIHASRMPQKYGEGDLSIIEQYHQLSLEAGARIRDGLSNAVEKSIISVANGFLKHSANNELRSKLRTGEITNEQYYQYLLRFIYRVLFLMVLEERNIVYPNKRDDNQDYLHNIYYNYYSITRIRKLSENHFFFDEKLEDLWISLRNIFQVYGNEKLAAKLGIYPLNGELFGSDSLGILSESDLDNHTLLECIRNLSLFENPETHGIIHVNYAALNVEEFGSVYEGLLEKAPSVSEQGDELRFTFIKGKERSSSGSHYTPEELVQPLIKHSLDYIIEEKLKTGDKDLKEKNLLSIKVCDVACGSGHILLSAARRIAIELARVRTGEDQPSPEPYRHAIRDVINHCIYGVDKNPLAVELCKVALWLEAYNPGMPLSFLDHRIKCGDSIVGLARIEELQKGIASEAFKTIPDDNKEIAAELRKSNEKVRKNRKYADIHSIIEEHKGIAGRFYTFNELADNTVEAVNKKAKEYDLLKGIDWWKLKETADVQVAQFFISKTKENKSFLTTDEDYFKILSGQNGGFERKKSTARVTGVEKKFFHWFLEFPEVMQDGGFDCILGNPPFLGGQRLSGTFGDDFLNWLKFEYSPAGSCDLVTYFFRRVFDLLKEKGFQGLLATNTIAQGVAREGGLDVIIDRGGSINFAVRSMKWPGVAAVEVSLVNIYKGDWRREREIGNRKVNFINSYLDDSNTLGDPFPLKQIESKSFQGSIVLGKGFILTPETAQEFIAKDPKNKNVLFPYLNGEDLNTNPDQSPSRWVINFFDWTEEYCRHNYPDCFQIVESYVKPERMKLNLDNATNRYRKNKWWLYGSDAKTLYRTISGMEKVLVIAQVSKIHGFFFSSVDKVISMMCVVITSNRNSDFAVLQSSFHEQWVRKYGSTLETRFRYTPTDVFENYPFPNNIKTEIELENIGEMFYKYRKQIMSDLQLGLTKTYNLFHCKNISADLSIEEANQKKDKDIKYLFRHIFNTPNTFSFVEAILGIVKLRELNKKLDEAVLHAYGWTDINLAHDFYGVDYLPENDRVRYTISPEARKEILKRLLALNHQIHAQEEKSGIIVSKREKNTNNNFIVKENQSDLFK